MTYNNCRGKDHNVKRCPNPKNLNYKKTKTKGGVSLTKKRSLKVVTLVSTWPSQGTQASVSSEIPIMTTTHFSTQPYEATQQTITPFARPSTQSSVSMRRKYKMHATSVKLTKLLISWL